MKATFTCTGMNKTTNVIVFQCGTITMYQSLICCYFTSECGKLHLRIPKKTIKEAYNINIIWITIDFISTNTFILIRMYRHRKCQLLAPFPSFRFAYATFAYADFKTRHIAWHKRPGKLSGFEMEFNKFNTNFLCLYRG